MALKKILLLTLTFTAALLFTTHRTFAGVKDFVIFDMRKTLPLNDRQAVQRDYYINMGEEYGAKVGALLDVYRRVPVVDIYRDKPQGDLLVKVGQLRIIHTQKSMSVTRLVGLSDPKNIPVVLFESVMLGDRVEVAENQAVEEPARKPATEKELPKKHKPSKPMAKPPMANPMSVQPQLQKPAVNVERNLASEK